MISPNIRAWSLPKNCLKGSAEMKRIAVIGAGPAGLVAGAFAKTPDTSVEIFDRNEKAGK
ncbi:MAG: NAD(P)/FAD-dependent oxidoreductase, partial [Clostridia bacterium]|nr:NAD(P)/FAD-dependent oxidoreductase [Clostridia bacterium]